MKPSSTSPSDALAILAFGAHPDDIEFGCGAVIARETSTGSTAHFVVCSRGESASNGTPEERVAEAEHAAGMLGATVEFADLGGDAHLERKVAHALTLAAIIRRAKPRVVLAPTLVENQHPDHAAVGHLVRDAARLARYGGVAELRDQPAHAIGQLLYYAVTPDAQPRDLAEILFDVSPPAVIAAWTEAMQAHASQQRARDYAGMQLARARLNGARCGAEHAVPLFPADPLVVDGLASLARGARHF
ncbi:MAG: PIG-L family deacetylase [Opitutaceae bacterium]